MNQTKHQVLQLIIGVFIFMLADMETGAQTALKILPLGNSITQGTMCVNGDISSCSDISGGQQVAYRLRLKTLLTAAGYNTDFIGNYLYGYSLMSDCENGGFGGIRSDQLADVMEKGSTSTPYGWISSGPYLNTYQPDIILLHIGTNDVLWGPDYYNTVAHVDRILDAVDDYETSHGRNVVVFLARIISERNYGCNTHTATRIFNNLITNLAQARISSGDKLVLVDMECDGGMDYFNDMADEVHPNQTGYDKMGEKWFQVINAYNTAPVVSQIPDQVIEPGGAFSQINLDDYVSDVEDQDFDISWSISPADPDHFYVTIDGARRVTISPKNPEWSGDEDILFNATDQGKYVLGLQKTTSVLVNFSVSWIPQINGQNEITIAENSPHTVTPDDLIIGDPENAPGGIEVLVDPGDHYSVDGAVVSPEQNFSGMLLVPVRIRYGSLESETFYLVISVTQVSFPPVIMSTPEDTGKTNVTYSYQIIAVDQNPEDQLSYFALQKPAWMEINGSTGLVSGTPGRDDVGESVVTLVVSDGIYDVEQSFNLKIVYYNNPPEIISVPKDTAIVSVAYTYGIQASDAEGDPLIYFANTIPDWLNFQASARVLLGIPREADIGQHSVILGVTDLFATTYQSFTLTVDNNTSVSAKFNHYITLYPNPVTSILYLQVEGSVELRGGLSFHLYDLTGRHVMQHGIDRNINEIDLSSRNLHDGVYLFRLLTETERQVIYTGKIILKITGK